MNLCGSTKRHYRLNGDFGAELFSSRPHTWKIIFLNSCEAARWMCELASELWAVRTRAERLMSTVVFPGITRVVMFRCAKYIKRTGCAARGRVYPKLRDYVLTMK